LPLRTVDCKPDGESPDAQFPEYRSVGGHAHVAFKTAEAAAGALEFDGLERFEVEEG